MKKLPAILFINILLHVRLYAGSHGHTSSAAPPEASHYSGSLSAAWDSRYVYEGRDYLDGDSLFSVTLEAEYAGFVTGAWIASSPDTDYDELNLSAGYGRGFGPVELAIGYTYVNFLSDNADDHEIGTALAINGLPLGITPAIDWYYSIEADGAFIEARLEKEFEVTEHLKLAPFASFGWNAGYIDDGHDGANHVAAGLAVTVPLGERFEIGAYAAYNFAIHSNAARHGDDELLKDFLYGGIALTTSF